MKIVPHAALNDRNNIKECIKYTMKTLITRADDFASSHAANLGIAQAAEHGFLKNISIMAVCEDHIGEAATLLAHRNDLCFGLHAVLNSEWDNVRWGPLTGAKSLLDSRKSFYQDPSSFLQHPPDLEEVMGEVSAQYEFLKRVGFHISYAEMHLLPERFLPGLQEKMSRWMQQEGLLDFSFFLKPSLPHMNRLASHPAIWRSLLESLQDGQYFYLTHPALYGNEMLQTGNAFVNGEIVARKRAEEAAFLNDTATLEICCACGVKPIRLDEAVPGEYLWLTSSSTCF